MNCDTMQLLIHGYMDGELDAVTNVAVEAHLADCPDCRRELESFRTLQVGLRDQRLYSPVPSMLEERIMAGLGEARPTPSVQQSVDGEGRVIPLSVGTRPNFRRYAFALAAVLIVGLLATWQVLRLLPTNNADTMIASEVVSSHIRSLMVTHLIDVVSTDKHTVKPWFDGKLDFAPPVERLPGNDFELIGGRLDYIDNRPVAAVVYRHRKHIVNLFIWPNTLGATAPTATSMRGYQMVHWSTSSMTFWAVSDTAPADLALFAQEVRDQKG